LQLVVCKETKVGPSTFLHSGSKSAFTVDFISGTAAAAGEGAEGAFPDSLEGLRSALQNAMYRKAKASYGRGEGAEFGVAVVPQDGNIVIVLSAAKARLASFWSGRWVARYTLSNISGNTAQLVGHLDVLTHYYEAGNVQLKSSKDWAPVQVEGSGDADFAKSVVGSISAWETAYETALQELFEGMGSSTLKELRRALPISGSKMNWNLAQHRTVGSLGQAAAAANA
jgi:capping protein alpha